MKISYTVLAVVLALTLALGAAGVYLKTRQSWEAPEVDATTSSSGAQKAPVRIPPAGFLEYHHDLARYSLFYPDYLEVKEAAETGGIFTTSFQNVERVAGFQIYVQPYTQQTITDERFHSDIPSGIRKNVAKATIGGVEAVVFESSDPALGPTFEVWFIKYGYLYEVTTLLEHKASLLEVLKTLEFY